MRHSSSAQSSVDILQENILISENGVAKLGDFGLSRTYMETEHPEFAHTTAGQSTRSAGTLRFKAPELLFEDILKSPSTDIWAFGMTLYQVRVNQLRSMLI